MESTLPPVLKRSEIEPLLAAEGFTHFGIAKLETPISIAMYVDWLKEGLNGEMKYLERHLEDKRDPKRLLKSARSAIVVTLDYVPHPRPVENWPLTSPIQVAAYAQGFDYHFLLKERLSRVIAELKALAPEEEFVAFTDSSPVLERDLAVRAGLGWVGKNTCLIDRKKGSLFLIAEIYTTLNLPIAEITSPDHCGTCTRCMDACPTGALVEPRKLDARKCISYLTIESRTIAPIDLRDKIGDWLFGCDICQTVCPWNAKIYRENSMAQAEPDSAPAGAADHQIDHQIDHQTIPQSNRQKTVNDLQFLLGTSNRGLEKAFRSTPLLRAGGQSLKRNAIVVAANLRMHEVTPEIERLKEHPKLGEIASWASKILQDHAG